MHLSDPFSQQFLDLMNALCLKVVIGHEIVEGLQIYDFFSIMKSLLVN